MDIKVRFRSVRPVLGASIVTLLLFRVAHQSYGVFQDGPASTTVRLADLDLQNEGGIETLYKGIRHAAHTVCDKAVMDADISPGDWWRCYRDTVEHAVAQLDNSRFTAMYPHGRRKDPG